MPNQIVLSWSVSVAGSSRSPAQAQAALAGVPLYDHPTTDPVLGQLLGLTVAADVTAATATGAARTLTLNMTSAAGAPTAPPPFPCHPSTSSPPAPPYPLTTPEPLEGGFLVTSGSNVVQTTVSQLPTLVATDVVQFSAQPGVSYAVTGVSAGAIAVAPPFSGQTADSAALQLVPAPVASVAVYSSSPLDDAAGSGARSVSLSYSDSAGNPGTVVVPLSGRRPVQVPLAGGTTDVATVADLHVQSVGGFGNSVGQITLSALTAPILADDDDDDAQLKLGTPVAYLPPSYFALAQQGPSAPQLAGDFLVTTGSADVPTSVDQTGVLSPGAVVQFAAQSTVDTPFGAQSVTYVVDGVSPRMVRLRSAFTGLGPQDQSPVVGLGTKGLKSTEVSNLPTAATLVSLSPAAPPSNAALAGPLAQFVNPGIAVPPPDPPLPPATMLPVPTLLSGLFTQQLQLALAGVPVVPSPIGFV